MALDQYGNGFKYRNDEGGYSVYELWVEGRPILEMSVNNMDPDLTIQVGKPGATFAIINGIALGPCELITTNGRARKIPHPKDEFVPQLEKMAEDGATVETLINTMPEAFDTHIDGATVYSYVYPRLLRLIADVYVPKTVD